MLMSSLYFSSSSSSFKPHLHHPTTKTNTCCFLSFKPNNSLHYYYYYHHHQTTTPRTRKSHYCCGCGGGGGGSEWEKESLLLEEGRRAVATYIEQLGVSKEDSITIASNSPSYLNMLLDGVRDLDQLSMWECDDTSSSSSSFSLKDKIVHLATLKGGDNGAKVAYLESIGFTLSSSINLARYLIPSSSSSISSHSLPHLIHNVNSIKLLLFSHDDDSIPIVKIIRRMMRFLSIPIDEDLQHTLSFFAKLEARRGGLNTLAAAASKDSAFVSLIESFPRLLLLSANNHVLPLFHFLENFGIPRPCIPYILLCFPPILLWNPQLLKTRLLALKQIDVVGNDYAKLLIQYPWLLSASIQDNYEDVLDFFYTEKIPKTLLDRAIKSQPHLLACSTSKLKLMVDQFAELGVKSKKLDKVIAKSPQLLLRNPKDFQQTVLFFENMGFDYENIGRILARCPEIFASSINKTLQRKIEFLSGIGVCETYLARVIRKYPELLVCNTDRTLLHRLVYLMKLGLSEKDIAFMVRTFSPLLGYSIEEVLRPKIEFLMNSMERPVRDVVIYPRYFSYSLEKKIKPRYWTLKGRNIECSLKDMLGKNDEEFAAEFMGPPLASHDRL